MMEKEEKTEKVSFFYLENAIKICNGYFSSFCGSKLKMQYNYAVFCRLLMEQPPKSGSSFLMRFLKGYAELKEN